MESLKLLLEIILQGYLNQSYCLTIISENNTNFDTINVQTIRLDKSDLTNIYLATDMGCSDFVVQMEKPENFVTIFNDVHRLSNARRGDRKMIFLPMNHQESLQKIIQLKPITYIANVLLIVPKRYDNNCEEYDLVTHKFIGPEDERLTEPIVIDTWNGCSETFELNANLFPHDIENLLGKKLKVACFTYKPFTMQDLDEHGGRDGLDVRLIEEFCRWVNCTIELVNEDQYQWGIVYPNGTGFGVMGDVASDKADFGISSIGQWYSPYQVMDLSMMVYRCAVTCIVPEPSLMSRWELPWLAFSVAIWATILFVLVYASLVLFLAQGCNGRKSYLITIGIALAQPQTYSSSWRVRSVLLVLVLTGITIHAAYSAGLSAIFTVPSYGKSIDTLQDLIDSGMEWAAPHQAWTYSMLPSTEPRIQKLLKKFRKSTPEEMKERSVKKDIALAIETLPTGYWAIGSYVTSPAVNHYQVMLEDFYYEYSIVLARKSSPYVGKLNKMIARLHETGIYSAWNTQIALQYLDNKVQLAVKYSRIKNPPQNAALCFSHVMGIFIIQGLGMCLAFLVFLGEIMYARHKRNNEIIFKTA